MQLNFLSDLWNTIRIWSCVPGLTDATNKLSLDVFIMRNALIYFQHTYRDDDGGNPTDILDVNVCVSGKHLD